MRLFLALFLFAATADERAAGERAWEVGDMAGALTHWTTATQQAREAGDKPAEADLLLRIAAVHRTVGKLQTAKAFLDAAAKLDAGPARVANDRGLLALAGGDAKGAEKLFTSAFDLARGATDPAGAANAAVNLGLARLALGRGASARKAFDGARGLFATLGDDRGRADALTDMGLADRRAGDLRTARQELEDAVTVFRAEGDGAGECDALTNLGAVYVDLGMDETAGELYTQGLAIARTRKDVPRQAALLTNLGTVAHRAGDVKKAAAYYTAAEDAWTSIGKDGEAVGVALDRLLLGKPDIAAFRALLPRVAKDRRQRAIASLNLAGLVLTTDPVEAAKLLSSARADADALELSDVTWRADYLTGKLELAAGRADAGIAALKRAVDVLEVARRTLDADSANRFLISHEPVYAALIDALLAKGDSMGAFVYTERLQLSMLSAAPLPDDPQVVAYREAVTQEAWLKDAVANSDGGDPEKTAALKAQLSTSRVEFAAAVDTLRASYVGFSDLVRVDPEDIEAVQQDLDPGVVVIEPVLLPDKVAILVFSRDTMVVRTVPVAGNDVGKVAGRLARSLRAADMSDPEWTTSQGDQLGKWLLEPIAADIANAKVVVFCASGALRQLPLGLLRLEGKWLAERVAIANITHVGSLRKREAVVPKFHVDGPSLLLVGNPDGSLPGAEAEVLTIGKRYPGSRVLVGSEGTKDALMKQVDGRSTIHLATHGLVDTTSPERSLLVLAGFPDIVGRLSYRDIPGLAPWLSQARLVVLSACESGLPVDAPPRTPDDPTPLSINGLAAQFRRAGVESMVASLWKVSDAGTMQLMDGFYGDLSRGGDIARSMQTAQKALIASKEWSHPWYWAPFIVVGDWR